MAMTTTLKVMQRWHVRARSQRCGGGASSDRRYRDPGTSPRRIRLTSRDPFDYSTVFDATMRSASGRSRMRRREITYGDRHA
jgi:hypothetical protein